MDILSNRLIYPGDRIKQQIIQLHHLQDRFIKTWQYQTEKRQWKLLELTQRIITVSPNISRLEQRQKELLVRMHHECSRYFSSLSIRMQHLQVQLSHLNPQSVLARGYSITFSMRNNIIICDSKQINPGDKIQVKFAHGLCEADVTKTKNS